MTSSRPPLANIPTGAHAQRRAVGGGGLSTSVRLVEGDCEVSFPLGLKLRRDIGSADHANQSSGKAGRSRWLGKRPTVRGSAMNPVDHPHGGGEGKTKGGRHPVTPWGVPTLGKRTRRKHKASDQLIVRGRRRGKERKR
jgi:large subunit ribosomal protein L2